MNALTHELGSAGRRLAATPAAMFVAVLTAGLALASGAQHWGLYNAGGVASRRSSVVLACPRTSAAKPASVGAHGSGSNAGQSSTASTAAAQSGASAPSEKRSAGKTGGSGLSVPLPDFNAPELSRFISPL